MHGARPQVLDRVILRANRFAAVVTGHARQFLAAARLPQRLVVLLPCSLDLRRELAPQMLRNRRVIGARSQVRKVRVHLRQELASIAPREPFADALADLGLISALLTQAAYTQ